MRQTEPERAEEGSARLPARTTLPLRFQGRAGDDMPVTAVIERRSVMLSRPIAGLPCLIEVAAATFRGIAVVECEGVHRVRLVHDDPGLTLDLTESGDRASALGERDRLAAELRLPALLAPDEGAVDGTEMRLGGILASAARARRVRLKARPRFLSRRQTGGEPEGAPFVGREIIART
ncbi:DUF6101 family protein [Propylenella binzhouense]|uniref:Uncharacterized protein n=1 Tax=Propylenella binzhouense TaxID=2555902 RepID=A0A964WV86_9HYPH|nr:DUF6101 family protein [Propylenella binzhouense]MYZ49911.1 hypothetical protein [Propylenella binzhouense]